MDSGNHPLYRIVHQHRNAIRGTHGDHDARLIGDQRIPASLEAVFSLDWLIQHKRIRPMHWLDLEDDRCNGAIGAAN